MLACAAGSGRTNSRPSTGKVTDIRAHAAGVRKRQPTRIPEAALRVVMMSRAKTPRQRGATAHVH